MSGSRPENPQDLPAARDVRASAAAWLERRVGETWNQEDAAELEAWLAQSATNRVAYMRVNAAWQKADRMVVLQTPPFRPAAVAKRASIGPVWLRIAAALIVLSAIGIGANTYFARPQGGLYATAVGDRKTVTLADGTRIELNTDTSLRISLTKDRRSVTLEKGEALFRVTHNAARPFVVTVGNHRITDLGTEFAIRRDASGVKVSLVKGMAQFERTDAVSALPPAILTPGDVLVATANTFTVTRKPAHELDNALAWRRGALVFFHTSLAEAAEEINRYNAQKVVVADAEAARLKINGTFPVNDVRLFGRVAHVVLGVSVQNKGNEVVISR